MPDNNDHEVPTNSEAVPNGTSQETVNDAVNGLEPSNQVVIETVEDRVKFSSMMRQNGQLLCKHATIAGSKDGGCERYGVEICHDCQQPFCPDHASVIDPFFCSDCLSPQTMELTKEPLTEQMPNGDVVTHKGVKITPSVNATAYKSLSRQIVDMTDDELAAFIREEGMKVKQAESVRDYHLIAKSSAMVEQDFRVQDANRRLRGVKLPVRKLAAGQSPTNPKTGQPTKGVDALGAILKMMGLDPTPENLMKVAQFLASKKS